MTIFKKLYQKLDALQRQRWFKVFASIVFVGLAVGGAFFLSSSNAEWLPSMFRERRGYDPQFMIVTAAAVFAMWWLLVTWLDLSITSVLILLATAALVALAWAAGWSMFAVALAGIGVLSFTFIVLIQAALLILRYPSQIFAVAHTVVKESVRLRVSVFFIGALLIILPLVPIFVASEKELAYRIQSYISWSTGLTFYLAAFMTIFLGCATVSFEIRDRQIWQLMTKPVSRLKYLIGKWLGIMAVNVVLLVVAGLSIFLFIQYLQAQPAANLRDRVEVDQEILSARVGRFPQFEPLSPRELTRAVDEQIEKDVALRTAIEMGERSERTERRRIAREIQTEHLRLQRTIDPGTYKTYTFPDLEGARDSNAPMKLRYQIHYGGEDTHSEHPMTIVVEKNDKVFNMDGFLNPNLVMYVPTMTNSEFIPPSAVSDFGEHAGDLRITLINGGVNARGDLFAAEGTDRPFNFDPEDIEVLYTVGGFEMNYVRALLVMWIKLSFMAMVSIAAATLLSFPVACLMAFTFFLAAVIGPFLDTALSQFYVTSGWRIDRIVIRLLGLALVYVFAPFGEINPTQNLVEGRLIPWSMVGRAFLLLGIVWTSITLALGYFAFRDRELATYSGHG